MSLIDLYIKDNTTGRMHKIGDDQHDMLVVDEYGIVRYENLQTGEGSKYGGYSFVPNTDKYGYPFNPIEMYNESEKARFNVRAVWKG